MILVTGGTGYIGSHTVVQLLVAGHKVLILDNLCNSKVSVLNRIEQISGKSPKFINGDIRDRTVLKKLFDQHNIHSIIHFAGLKAVGESVAKPELYYNNNVYGSLVLIEEMALAGVKKIVFSSSATVYGDPQYLPYTENHPLAPTNPYGQSKLMVEQILRDISNSDPDWSVALLRYFNPVGAHESGLMGEDPSGIPNNLMPFVAQVAVGKREYLSIFGNDYDTFDGTGVRDYIHVDDLAAGHLAAVQKLDAHQGVLMVNLGTGHGTSVLQLVKAFEQACGHSIAHQFVERRAGDLAAYWADTTYAKEILGWTSRIDINRMCVDTWRWQSMNPNGYES
jgi:UDP-glucose 4-epimerase